jgi:hypothetical protein
MEMTGGILRPQDTTRASTPSIAIMNESTTAEKNDGIFETDQKQELVAGPSSQAVCVSNASQAPVLRRSNYISELPGAYAMAPGRAPEHVSAVHLSIPTPRQHHASINNLGNLSLDETSNNVEVIVATSRSESGLAVAQLVDPESHLDLPQAQNVNLSERDQETLGIAKRKACGVVGFLVVISTTITCICLLVDMGGTTRNQISSLANHASGTSVPTPIPTLSLQDIVLDLLPNYTKIELRDPESPQSKPFTGYWMMATLLRVKIGGSSNAFLSLLSIFLLLVNCGPVIRIG